ncbi:lipopolysaccharide biosynthesis protein [Tichowtungia aerotolerans]|uniref:Oligosaccharide flippase family protein n=1 Tax=Tichowtungia aerotolerans TaxID=2697043 RepID=A0A6P1M8G7_9BACT|nr:lipopolysaccharide biosynthesis protein [Tichowtungia aerotolerans]QHI70187.1 oligosaccharide flippase family protein [Tichowtungia aerotolerans]
MASLRKKTLKGMQWSLIGSAGNSILQMVVMVVITRLIAPEEFGVMAMAQLFVQFATFFANFGVGVAIIRNEELTEDHIAAGFWCGIVISLFIALVMFLLAPLSTHLLDSSRMPIVVRLLALNFFFNGFGIVSMSLLQKEMRFGFLALMTLSTYALGYGLVGIPLAIKGYGVYALVFCMLTQTALRVVTLLIAAHHRVRPSRQLRIYKETLSFGGQHSCAGFLSFLGSSVDRMMLGRWGGAEMLGIYSRSSQLINYPIQFLSSSIMRVLFPGFSSIQRDTERMRASFLKSVSMMAVILVPVAFFASFTSRDLILLAYGLKWAEGWPALVAYSWVAPLCVLGVMGMMINDIIGKQWYRIRIHMEALIVFAVCIWFGLRFGIKGVAVGVVVGYFYRFVFTGLLVCRLLHLDRVKFVNCFFWPCIVGVVSVAVPLLVLFFGGGLVVWIRLMFSALGAGLSLFVLVVCVSVPPLVQIAELIEGGYPRIGSMLKFIKR